MPIIDKKTKHEIDSFIDARRAEIVADIAELVKIPSITGDVKENRRALDFLTSRADGFGFETSMTREGDVAVIDLVPDSASRDTVGILVHVDVVGTGDLSKWSSNPFELTLKDGFIVGRGTADDKGPAVLSLFAMRAISELGIAADVPRIRLIAGTSEESKWTDIAHYKSQYDIPCYGFSPDGEFPIYNEENGYADVLLTFPLPDGIEILTAGTDPNTVPSRAEIKFKGQDPRVFHGFSAHSSVPETGDNAILKLCAAQSENGVSNFDFCRFICDYFTNESQTLLTFENSPAAPTTLKSADGKVMVNINIRHAAGVSREQIEQAFSSKSGSYGYKYKITEYLNPMHVDTNQPFLKTMLDVYKAYGLPGNFGNARGTSYAKSMPNFVSWGPVLPGDPDTAHKENERLSIETALTSAKLYASYLASLDSAKG
jgi:succinyl-diaminopimelate desuccinylase